MADVNAWQHVLPGIVGCTSAGYAGFRARRGDLGVGNHGTRRIGDRADNRCFLGKCLNRGKGKQGGEQHQCAMECVSGANIAREHGWRHSHLRVIEVKACPRDCPASKQVLFGLE